METGGEESFCGEQTFGTPAALEAAATLCVGRAVYVDVINRRASDAGKPSATAVEPGDRSATAAVYND